MYNKDKTEKVVVHRGFWIKATAHEKYTEI